MAAILRGILAIVAGVGGTVLLFYVLNYVVERLSPEWESRLKPYVFIGPAAAVVAAFLIFPALDTVRRSFLNAESTEFVGLQNFGFVFTNPEMQTALWNNVMWLVVVPVGAVVVGLAVATLADRLKPRWENIAKGLIFMPMAVSFVGASTIWGFMYAWRPEGRPQIGLLNQVAVALGFEMDTPILQNIAINDFALMFIMVWLQAGFAMVLLSAAIKNVPEDTIEAARVDGATELQIFWRVVFPQIRSTIAVVTTTILILVLKIFDIVRVLTGGQFNTEVVANRFITELFRFRQFGRAAAIVVVLVLATIPVMVWNIRRFREQEATR